MQSLQSFLVIVMSMKRQVRQGRHRIRYACITVYVIVDVRLTQCSAGAFRRRSTGNAICGSPNHCCVDDHSFIYHAVKVMLTTVREKLSNTTMHTLNCEVSEYTWKSRINGY